MDEKKCSKCNITKALNNFYKTKKNKDGYFGRCKDCTKKESGEYYDKNKDKKQKYIEKNKELIAKQNKQWYSKNKENANERRRKKYPQQRKDKKKEYNDKNKVLIKKAYLKRYANNKEYFYIQVHKRRSRINKVLLNDFTKNDWIEIKKFFENKCAYCGKENVVLEKEHVISISKAGSNTKKNIVTACRNCNASKSNKALEEWYPEQKFYTNEREQKILKWIDVIKKETSYQISLF